MNYCAIFETTMGVLHFKFGGLTTVSNLFSKLSKYKIANIVNFEYYEKLN